MYETDRHYNYNLNSLNNFQKLFTNPCTRFCQRVLFQFVKSHNLNLKENNKVVNLLKQRSCLIIHSKDSRATSLLFCV